MLATTSPQQADINNVSDLRNGWLCMGSLIFLPCKARKK